MSTGEGHIHRNSFLGNKHKMKLVLLSFFSFLFFAFISGVAGPLHNHNILSNEKTVFYPSWCSNPEVSIYVNGIKYPLFKVNENKNGLYCDGCQRYSKMTESSGAKANYKYGNAQPQDFARLKYHFFKDGVYYSKDHNGAMKLYIKDLLAQQESSFTDNRIGKFLPNPNSIDNNIASGFPTSRSCSSALAKLLLLI